MADEHTTDDLSIRQHHAIMALLSEPSIRKASERCGVPERTLYGWLANDADFKAAYARARRAAVEQASARLQHHTSEAVQTVLSIMKNTRTNAATRLAAAKTILEMSADWLQSEDMLRRIEELERANQPSDYRQPARTA